MSKISLFLDHPVNKEGRGKPEKPFRDMGFTNYWNSLEKIRKIFLMNGTDTKLPTFAGPHFDTLYIRHAMSAQRIKCTI